MKRKRISLILIVAVIAVLSGIGFWGYRNGFHRILLLTKKSAFVGMLSAQCSDNKIGDKNLLPFLISDDVNIVSLNCLNTKEGGYLEVEYKYKEDIRRLYVYSKDSVELGGGIAHLYQENIGKTVYSKNDITISLYLTTPDAGPLTPNDLGIGLHGIKRIKTSSNETLYIGIFSDLKKESIKNELVNLAKKYVFNDPAIGIDIVNVSQATEPIEEYFSKSRLGSIQSDIENLKETLGCFTAQLVPSSLNIDSATLVGIWQASGGMAAGWADRYHFYENGKFHFYPNQMSCKLLRVEKLGTWELKNGSLKITTTAEIENNYKCPNCNSCVSVNTKETVMKTPVINEYKFESPKIESGDFYPSTKLGEIRYWKFSDDPTKYALEKFPLE